MPPHDLHLLAVEGERHQVAHRVLVVNRKVACWAASGHVCHLGAGVIRPSRSVLLNAVLAHHHARLGQPPHPVAHPAPVGLEGQVGAVRRPVRGLFHVLAGLAVCRAGAEGRPGQAACPAQERVLHWGNPLPPAQERQEGLVVQVDLAVCPVVRG